MNKQIFNFLKFVIVFVGSTGLMLTLYYQLTTSEFDKKFQLFSPGKNKSICPQAPDNQSYSACIHRHIPSLLDEASPLDLLKFRELFSELKKQDLYFEKQTKEKIQRDFLFNHYSFYVNLSDYGVKRNRIDYFQVLVKPYVQNVLKKDLKEVQNALKNESWSQVSQDDKKVIERFFKIKLK